MKKTTIEFSEESSEKLAKLAKTLSTTKTDVLRSALSLYGFLEKELHGSAEKFLAIIDARDQVQKILVVRGLQAHEVIVMKRRESAPKIISTASAGL